MAFTSGTATNDTNLVQTLITFLTTNSDLVTAKQNWELLGRQSVVSGNITQDYISLRGPGLAEADNIYVHLEHYQYATTDTFSLRIVGSANYLASALTTPGSQPDNTMTNTAWSGNVILRMPMHRNPIQYWIVASGRRFIMVINHGNRWGCMHGGFILPFGYPDQYPYPLLVGACNSTTDSYQTPPVANFMYSSVSAQAGALRKPGGGWCAGPLGVGVGTGRYTCWPFDRGAGWQITSGVPMLTRAVWLQSYADERCGGWGITYQAANFLYCGYHISAFYELDGETYHNLLLTAIKRGGKRGEYLREHFARAKEVRLKQFRYIYFIKKHWIKRLQKPVLPYPKHYLNQVE